MTLRSDTVANLAIAVMCVCIGVFAVVKALPAKARAVRPNPYVVGEHLEGFADAKFETAEKTVLLVVSSNCRFCSESLPFYRRLVARVQQRSGVIRSVATMLDPPEIGQQYLTENKVVPDGLIKMPSLAWPRIQVTPTIIAVDRGGFVIGTWVGRLTTDQEQEVLAVIDRPL